MLHISDLNVSVGGRHLLHNIDLNIAAGERVGLIGASGSGKSMIARTIMGLLPQDSEVTGSIELGDEQLVGLDDESFASLRGAAMSMVFQNPRNALNPVLTVEQQIELPLRLHYALDAENRHQRVATMLERVGLSQSMAQRSTTELSGGQQQRVAIATALITSPRLIIADEPTTALDSTTQRQITQLLTSLVDDLGAAMLFITHDFSVLAHATNNVVVLNNGSIIERGSTRELLEHPQQQATRQLIGAARALSLHIEEGGAHE
ncbi:diguanylate cyclase [Bifidobacterium dolichotidis]|uniref:Diguanylate cyclase n=1 Tax=Bifidobacterium dolichotidis TaxID=2306976 RepID=A0A430FPW5_9BIFI|nr:ABC transporter ATP-binding protein [Bifidobacterium dolichotidis]RSX54834.1 diguanylate cyclase [Bifidobacterium dolichotidis]